ncbi:HNH endonuclease [Mesorhizobium sp. CGMCC 1.15528]|uniref:HNH endonuclease n=1 Tax=Mesorhizobium zhangyense TaxID=1776730 RepID=A0A7C9VGW2_9HYPH|nr:HNH endonuclease [Mesorhizobium zhangyense]
MTDKRPHHRTAAAQAYRPWYGLKIWKNARQTQLALQPLCERCLQSETVTEATVVNHRQPHKGDWSLFIDPDNHESLCAPHHDALVQKEEARGYAIGADIDGRPIDPLHPWSRS